jgi:hypothetical protein
MSDEFFHGQLLLTDPTVKTEFHAARLLLQRVDLQGVFFHLYLDGLQSFGLK